MTVARNRFGPPGRPAELGILYAEGGSRDACLPRDELLDGPTPAAPPGPIAHPDPSARTGSRPTPSSAWKDRYRPIPMRLLHLLWPHLPLRLARARLERTGRLRLVAGRPDRPRRTAVDGRDRRRRGPAGAGARRASRAIPLGSAHRLAPEATFLDLDPDADRDAVEAACERLAAFSPGIAGTSDVADPAFGRLAVHVDGLTRLWGIEERLVARIGRR